MTPDTPPPHDPLLTGPLPSEEPAGDSYLPVGPGAESHPSVRALLDRFPEGILRHEYAAGDQAVVWIDPARTLEILGWLRDDPGHRYDLLVDITAVDYGGGRPLTVVWQLWSIPHRRQLRLKAELPLDGLAVPSVWPLWKSSNWLEREVFDLFGITFEGHPDLRRILMPENYAEGHPLRKDFPLRGRFSREEQTRRALAQDHEADYIPVELEGDREAQLLPGSPEPLRFATNEEEGDGL